MCFGWNDIVGDRLFAIAQKHRASHYALCAILGEAMFTNHIKTAFRNLVRHRVFSAINIIGLAVGMACTILILLWVQDELSYDRFHNNADNIYLVLRGDNEGKAAVTSALLGPALRAELPDVVNAGCLEQLPESYKAFLQTGTTGFEETISLADSSFFSLFSFRFLRGSPATALRDPYSIVITEEIAKKYFGREDALGKILKVTAVGRQGSVKVDGVVENIPRNSHMQGRLFFSIGLIQALGIPTYGWQNQSVHTYIQSRNRLHTDGEIRELASRILACELRHDPNQPKTLGYSLLPLTRIHLHGNNINFLTTDGDIKYVQMFMLIAVIILLIASINYMNLSTAMSMRRAKEIGIKKALGADRKTLILQFFGESCILSFLALGFARVLVKLVLPEFNNLSGKQLVIGYGETQFIAIALLVALITGMISGSYPALFLSSFSPVQILKRQLRLSQGSLVTRKGLVVIQFALSIIIIVCTIVVFHQLSFIRNSHLGFDKENLICVRMAAGANSRFAVLKNELQQNPAITQVAQSEPVSTQLGKTLGVIWRDKPANYDKSFWVLHTDVDLAATYKFEMSQGRYYSDRYPTDSTNAYVLNEAAVRAMGLTSPLNEEIVVWGRKGRIIGVTKDFHFASFHTAIEPLIIRIPDSNERDLYMSTMSVRFTSREPERVIASIERTWKAQMGDIPFNYYFFDDFVNAQYKSERTMGSLFKYFSFLSIFIACLGLFGLASISAQQRIREIGIRKVLGASIPQTAIILSREFLVWVVISNIIAFPVAWYAMNRWLEDFAYRVGIGWWTFALAGGLSLLIALLTVSTQAIKAALANPVESLRYE